MCYELFYKTIQEIEPFVEQGFQVHAWTGQQGQMILWRNSKGVYQYMFDYCRLTVEYGATAPSLRDFVERILSGTLIPTYCNSDSIAEEMRDMLCKAVWSTLDEEDTRTDYQHLHPDEDGFTGRILEEKRQHAVSTPMLRRKQGCCLYDDEDYEDDPEPQELPEMILDATGPCCICGQPGCENGCFSCGRPVCYATNYTDDSDCGSWLRDWWSNGAEEENAFLCNECLASIYEPAEQEESIHA